MKWENRSKFFMSAVFLTAFVVWTVVVRVVDVQSIGPQGSAVGLASLNSWVRELIGENLFLYILTDWLSLIPLGFVLAFGSLGLAQWIQRKKLWRVDRSILILGGFYLLLLGAYVFFEKYPVNYRPLLLNGVLEVSYPSSTTMLVLCIMPTALMQLRSRVKEKNLKTGLTILLIMFTGFMLVGRLLSGVHWFSDIVGGVLLSGGLVLLYKDFCDWQ